MDAARALAAAQHLLYAAMLWKSFLGNHELQISTAITCVLARDHKSPSDHHEARQAGVAMHVGE